MGYTILPRLALVAHRLEALAGCKTRPAVALHPLTEALVVVALVTTQPELAETARQVL